MFTYGRAMRMLKSLPSAIAVLVVATSCAPSLSPLQAPSVKPAPVPAEVFNLNRIGAVNLEGRTVKRMMVVFTRAGMNQKDYSHVFTLVKQLDALEKARARGVAHGVSAEALTEISTQIDQIVFQTDLMSYVAYVMLWGSQQVDAYWKQGYLTCRDPERCFDQRQNTAQFGEWIFRNANPEQGQYLPFLSTHGKYEGDFGQFEFDLTLRAEPRSKDFSNEIIYKGEAQLKAGSVFLDEPYGSPVAAEGFGYAEVVTVDP